MSIRDDVLLRLESSKGNYISGQSLADVLGVSRTAIWKAVDKLKKDGYDISTGAGGYKLFEGSDLLIEKIIKDQLNDKKIEIIILDSVDSTNDECKRLLGKGEKNFVVIANEQTAGRGRGGKNFYSPTESGLYISIALCRQMPLESALFVTTYTAVAVVETIKNITGLDCKIKWVNDIFYNDLKICGILTEAITDMESGNISDIIVGVGINLHKSNLPKELLNVAGALDCGPVKNDLAAALINRIKDFDENDRSHIDKYREYSFIIGKEINYVKAGEKYSGVAKNITDSGELIVKTDSGTEILKSGEVSLKF